MHYFVCSQRGSGKCHEDIDDARHEIIEDLVAGIKDAVKRNDTYDVLQLSKLMVDACSLESRPRWDDDYSSDYRIHFDSDHHWTIEECTSYTCTDTVKRGSW